MELFKTLLLDVWREACRHTEIGESTATIAAMLRPRMSAGQLLVRRFAWDRGIIETVAAGAVDGTAALLDLKSACSDDLKRAVLAWCEQGRVARRVDRAENAVASVLAPPSTHGDTVAGPLGDPQSPSGVLVAVAADGFRFDACQIELVQSLLEPFSVALENDHRLREMAALREAAEADRRSLLTRLGRKAIADTVVGTDSGLRGVMDRVELVARSDVPVLILGETGTGKELAARLIHNRSPRSSGPFIRVNCGAIPLELIDSQLFGHERGAFTGAAEARQGWFERADGGTLLLDEIGELPLAAQVRLLRILQDGWLERVGGHSPIHVDVRMVAATHRDLAAMVASGLFREDLWYRIAVFPIALPPLRERQEDIAALAAHFAEKAATRFGLPLVTPSLEDVMLLRTYSWPGNIRELAAVIDRAAILGNGKRLEVETALGAGKIAVSVRQGYEPPNRAPSAPGSRFPCLDEAMKQHIESALAITHGRIEGPYGAAKLLKINPHTLRARMRKLGIDWRRFRHESDST